MPHILIVEDDPTIRDQYASVLKKRGFSVVEARDTEEGLERLAADRPQLVILDLLMPGANGLAFLRTADIPHQYPETKVLVASNVETPEFARGLQEAKVDRFILKAEYNPFRLADLVAQMVGGV